MEQRTSPPILPKNRNRPAIRSTRIAMARHKRRAPHHACATQQPARLSLRRSRSTSGIQNPPPLQRKPSGGVCSCRKNHPQRKKTIRSTSLPQTYSAQKKPNPHDTFACSANHDGRQESHRNHLRTQGKTTPYPRLTMRCLGSRRDQLASSAHALRDRQPSNAAQRQHPLPPPPRCRRRKLARPSRNLPAIRMSETRFALSLHIAF